MDHADLQSRIEEISGAIVLVEPGDGKALNSLHGMLREVAQASEAAGFSTLAGDARKAGKIIEKLVFDAPANAGEMLAQAGTIVSSMQSAWRDANAPAGRKPAGSSADDSRDGSVAGPGQDVQDGETPEDGALEEETPGRQPDEEPESAGRPVELDQKSGDTLTGEDFTSELTDISIVDSPSVDDDLVIEDDVTEDIDPDSFLSPGLDEEIVFSSLAGSDFIESQPAQGELASPEGSPVGETPVESGESTPDSGPVVEPVASGVESGRPGFLPENADMEIFTEFLSRQPGVLEEMEEYILALDRTRDEGSINKLKRLIHTMKGESGLLGLNEVQKVCHATESLLEEGSSHAHLVDILLAVKDWLTRAFAAYAGNGIEPGPAAVLIELLFETDWVDPEEEMRGEVILQESPDAENGSGSELPVAEAETVRPEGGVLLQDGDAELLNDFINEASEHLESVESHMLTLESTPEDETSLNAVFRAFHTIKGVAGYLALDQIGYLAHDVENLLDRARKGDLLLKGKSIDALFEAVDMMKQLVANVRDAMANGTPLVHEPGLNSIVEMINQVARGGKYVPSKPAAPEAPAPPVETKPQAARVQQAQPAPEVVHNEKDHDDGEAQQRTAGDGQFVQVRESIKVDADRLDRLIDTIGELVITESMVSQMMRDKYSDAHMMSNLSQLDKITRQLQEMSTSLRMVPVRATFQKMARLVRDLAKKSGKRIDFIMTGEDTELDKSVVDKIGDPLVHMIRNAVDHGIESGLDRVKSGKPEVGRVELRAFHKGGSIFIEIADDGKGLVREKILAKAIENRLISEGSTLSEKEIFSLIFKPGFSTATVVTDVSGRGIGMDVVRRNIESLRGRIDIQSEPGRGSIFSIRLPLTLAIIDGMMVGVGDERYIIPTLSIVRSLRPEKSDFSSVQGRGEMYSLDGVMIPVFYLNRLFGVENSRESVEDGLLVVVENDGLYTGLVVDELFGQHQIVIKTLGRLLQGIPGISGSTIMTDGHVALILDIAGLVKLANREQISAGVQG
ncbi:MAG TPA: Hpt domain-containing protein [Spirochaetota bacterium]|nr:Hpt domain-containing protein [Spirochaetota bacterium]